MEPEARGWPNLRLNEDLRTGREARGVTYRPEIDGLRALAVLAVLFYHAELGCPGGYVGVDVFFVISGYLICHNLSQEIAAGTFTYRAFWARRIRRLLPALVLMLGMVVGVGWFLLVPADYRELGATVASQPFLVANFIFWRVVHKSYFGIDPETRPTMHTWSLAVEEQFYLLCPMLLLLLARRRIRSPGLVLAAFALASWLLSGLLTAHKQAFCYFLLPTRAFEILLGGLVWYAPIPRREAVSLLGFAAVGGSIFLLSEASVFPGWIALLPCLGTALLLNSAVSGSRAARLLALPPLVWVGKISYSVYLWHWPLIATWQYLFLPWTIGHRLLLVGLSLLFGFLSTQLLENPIRRRRWLASERSLFGAAALCGLVCLVSGLSLWVAQGFPQRFSPTARNYLQVDRGVRHNLSLEELQAHQFVRFGATGPGPRLFLWGDSHAMTLIAGLDELCRKEGVVGEAATYQSRGPFLCEYNLDLQFDPVEERKRYELICSYLRQSPPAAVALAARWRHYPPQQYQREFRQTLQFLQDQHIPTWIVLQVPDQGGNVPRRLARQSQWGKDLTRHGLTLAEHQQKSREFVDFLNSLPFPLSHRLDPASLLGNSSGICRTNWQGGSLYFDDNHLSGAGSRFLKPMYTSMLQEVRAQGNSR